MKFDEFLRALELARKYGVEIDDAPADVLQQSQATAPAPEPAQEVDQPHVVHYYQSTQSTRPVYSSPDGGMASITTAQSPELLGAIRELTATMQASNLMNAHIDTDTRSAMDKVGEILAGTYKEEK